MRLHREALGRKLTVELGFALVTSADTLADAVRAAGDQGVDVVLLDLAATPDNLSGVAEAVKASDARFVALGVAEADEAVAWAEAGVTGFLEAGGTLDELRAVLETVMRGELHCSARIATALARRLRELKLERIQPAVGRLTARELEILELIGRGLSNAEIAQQTQLQVSTVKNHVRSIFEKLQVRNRAAAVTAALSSHRRDYG
jgi:DNA-binding NarL/FixJ family response regulator